MSEPVRWLGLIVITAVCLGVGGLGAMATSSQMDVWYTTIAKPSWTPPDKLFGLVWTALYIMMAVAAWLVWRPTGFTAAAIPLTLFAVQLAFNAAWSWIFFGMQQPGWALVDIVLLWIALVATTILFFRQSVFAGTLLFPYLAWVSFAAALNFSIWRLNA